MSKHISVLSKEVIEVLSPKADEVAIDATLGGGGHAMKLLSAIEKSGKLIVMDADPQAIESFKKETKNFENVSYIVGNFASFTENLKLAGVEKADIILFDFGLSSDQLDDPARGFTFQKNGPLDMRLNPQNQEVTAADLLARLSEDELYAIFKNFGEEKNSKRIARAIVSVRKQQPLESTEDLFNLIKVSLPGPFRFKAADIARRIFQALRIAVNNELDVIKKGLEQAFDILSPGGRMVAISFHSLEDRIVKQTFAKWLTGCVCPPEFPVCVCGQKPRAEDLTPKVVIPSKEEQEQNPRSKSAKLRAIKKI